MYAYKDILELAGLTTRIYTLLSILHATPSVQPYKIVSDEVKLTTADIVVNERLEVDDTGATREPDTLVRELQFRTKQGDHLMITGPNGVGKSAIARVLKGLWDARGGSLYRPASAVSDENSQGGTGIFFVPQRAYHVHGTLLDQ
jgi:ATP-binding cassette subfamily D (ALD) long-chain fatty acid import protein